MSAISRFWPIVRSLLRYENAALIKPIYEGSSNPVAVCSGKNIIDSIDECS